MNDFRQSELDVLHEDNHVLVVNKPAGLPTMGVANDKASVLAVAKAYIKRKYDKPGNVYLGIVSRLDAPVTGTLIIARTSKAAARLTQQFRERNVEKSYLALVEGIPSAQSAQLRHWLRKDERHRKVHVTMKDVETAQEAKLSYEVVQQVNRSCALLRVTLETGRKHQIRVQLSAIGHPVIGDRKYKSNMQFAPGIALHSHRLVFEHPTKKTSITVQAPTPPSWNHLLRR